MTNFCFFFYFYYFCLPLRSFLTLNCFSWLSFFNPESRPFLRNGVMTQGLKSRGKFLFQEWSHDSGFEFQRKVPFSEMKHDSDLKSRVKSFFRNGVMTQVLEPRVKNLSEELSQDWWFGVQMSLDSYPNPFVRNGFMSQVLELRCVLRQIEVKKKTLLFEMLFWWATT